MSTRLQRVSRSCHVKRRACVRVRVCVCVCVCVCVNRRIYIYGEAWDFGEVVNNICMCTYIYVYLYAYVQAYLHLRRGVGFR